MKRDLLYCVIFGLSTCAPALAADWGFDAAAGVNYNDNVSNSIEHRDMKADGAATLGLSGGFHQQLDAGTGLGLSLVAEAEDYFRYSGLDNLAFGVRAQVRHKFGLGPHAPWGAFAVRALHRDYDYDFRDGWEYGAGFSGGQRIGERWNLSASVQYDRYEADDLQRPVLPGISTAAYDVSGWTFGVQAAYLLTEVDTISVSGSRRHGTVTAVTPPDFEVLEYSSAAAIENVFSGNPIAYRINADSDTISINWSRELGRHCAASLGYAYRRSRNDDLGTYTANMFNLSVSYSR